MRGIDLQTLFTRLTSFAKSSSANNKTAEISQMQLAAVEQHRIHKRERRVTHSEKSERSKLQREKRGRRPQQHQKSEDGRGQFIDISMP